MYYYLRMEEIYDTETYKQMSLAPQGMEANYQCLSDSTIDKQTYFDRVCVTVILMCVLSSVCLLLDGDQRRHAVASRDSLVI